MTALCGGIDKWMELFAHVTLTFFVVILPHTAFKMFPYTHTFLPASVPLLKPFLPPFSITP
jgi:hypothetical protein